MKNTPRTLSVTLWIFVTSFAGNAGADWVAEGPSPAHDGQIEGVTDRPVSGAINAVAAHPTDADIAYVGAVNGGIWKSTNLTASSPTWTQQTDDKDSLSIGDVVFDPADATHNTLVAGIGRTSSYASAGGSRDGLLRTTDGGATWTAIGTGMANRNVVKVAVNGARIVTAVNFAVPFTCSNVGLWRSTDTGATFTKLTLAGNGIPEGVATAVTARPGTPDTLYASMIFAGTCSAGGINGIYRSTDGGASWSKVSDATVDGGISDNSGIIEIDVAADGTVYVATSEFGELTGVFHSATGAAPWTAMDMPGHTEPGPPATFVGIHPGNQAGVHFSLAIDPTNSDIVYVGGDRQDFPFPNAIGAVDFSGRLFRGDSSAAPGSQWTPLTHSGTASNSSPHADSRDMTFDANGDLLEADDGGIYRRKAPQSASGDWFDLNGNIQVTEAHDTSFDSNSTILLTGNQDTGTTQQQTPGGTTWTSIHTGDGGDVAVDVLTLAGVAESVRFSSFQNLGAFRRRSYDASNMLLTQVFPALTVVSGPAFSPQFVTPVVVNQVDGARLIFGGSNGVYESLDQGDTIALLPGGAGVEANSFNGRTIAAGATGNPDALYVAEGGALHLRTTSGGSLSSIALPSTDAINAVSMDHSDPANAVYVTETAVYFSNALGGPFADITSSLASMNPGVLRSVLYVPGTSIDAIVVGADRGVFAIPEFGASWKKIGTLPNAPVFELEYDAPNDVLYAGTLGRGTFSNADQLGDPDGDSRLSFFDNCTLVANPSQCDSNGDGYGNHCDADVNDNGIVNSFDLSIIRSAFGTATPDPYNVSDLDCNGIVNSFDLTKARALFGQPPGPSGTVP